MVKNKNSYKIAIDKMPTVNWLIYRGCNYRCSYCVSGSKIAIGVPSPRIFLDKFAKHLSGNWIFNFCGSGEPFLAPEFLEIIKELVKRGHYIDITTNFTASLKQILKFCEIAGENLIRLTASLHLEHVHPNEFLKKALLVERITGDKLRVVSVARRGRVSNLKKIAQTFQDKGILFILQPERKHALKNNSPFISYGAHEAGIIRNFHGQFFDKNNLKFKGKLCWAGSRYFVINEKGDAWRCFPAYRDRRREGFLGNILEGTFNLYENPSVCLYQSCYCATPSWLTIKSLSNSI